MLLVSGWFSLPKTIIPEAGSTFSSHHHAANLILSVDWGVNAGVIAEVKPGAGPVAVMNRGVSPMERDRPFQG